MSHNFQPHRTMLYYVRPCCTTSHNVKQCWTITMLNHYRPNMSDHVAQCRPISNPYHTMLHYARPCRTMLDHLSVSPRRRIISNHVGSRPSSNVRPSPCRTCRILLHNFQPYRAMLHCVRPCPCKSTSHNVKLCWTHVGPPQSHDVGPMTSHNVALVAPCPHNVVSKVQGFFLESDHK